MMMLQHSNRLVAWIFAVVLGISCSTGATRAWAQESKKENKQESKSSATAPAASTPSASPEQTKSTKLTKSTKSSEHKSSGHRLPNYYADVVTSQQKEAIYKIQDEYEPKIKEIEKAHAALIQEQKSRIESVLTDEQKQKVVKAAEASVEKRAAKKTAAEAPAEKATEKKALEKKAE